MNVEMVKVVDFHELERTVESVLKRDIRAELFGLIGEIRNNSYHRLNLFEDEYLDKKRSESEKEVRREIKKIIGDSERYIMVSIFW